VRWKRLYDFAANLFRKPCTKFHQNRPSFIEDITLNNLVSFSDTLYILLFCSGVYIVYVCDMYSNEGESTVSESRWLLARN